MLNDVRTQKKKAANLLFEEIEHDILGKEKFVLEQTEKLKEMNDSYLTMQDYEKVLKAVAIIIPNIVGGGNEAKASMHGGVNINSDTESNYRVGSLNADKNNENAPLMAPE